MNTGDNKTSKIAQIISRQAAKPLTHLLVVGCGSGIEAAILGDELKAKVTGIDLNPAFDTEAAARVNLQVGDATAMPFADHSFDYVYSYHALEHIPNYKAALREMRRILVPGGAWCIGTPNRARLVGYLGSKDATIRQKLAWNLVDWKMRLQGKFRNEYGAHAGFTKTELKKDLTDVFGEARDITLDYYLEIYPHHTRKVRLIGRSGLGQIVFPSIYFLGENK